METEQRGAKKGCSGTMDNLLIDKMVTQDSQRGKKSLSMAWVDVTKAYDTVDINWLCEMMEVHRFPRWLGSVVTKLLQHVEHQDRHHNEVRQGNIRDYPI